MLAAAARICAQKVFCPTRVAALPVPLAHTPMLSFPVGLWVIALILQEFHRHLGSFGI